MMLQQGGESEQWPPLAKGKEGATVQVPAAGHRRDPALQREGYESRVPVRIGQNIWIRSGAIILPGVTIGTDAIIGAGSVVTRNVAAGATVMGNPARIAAREE